MRNADRDNAVRQRWPQETSTLQSLRKQAGALAVMPNDLDQVAAAAPKNVEIANVRITLQALLNQTRKARESAAHVGMTGRKPHSHITRYGNHRRSSTSRTRSSASGSTCASTRMRRRLPRSISISPFRAAGNCRIRLSSSDGDFEFSSPVSTAAAIRTGAKHGPTRSAVRACRRQMNTRLASLNFIPLILLWRGEIDQAIARSRAAFAAAQELGDAYTLSHVFHLNCWLNQHLGDSTTVRERAEAAMKLTAEHGFSLWEVTAEFWYGWALAAAGEITAGSAKMRGALSTHKGLGVINQVPFLLGLLADICTQAGDSTEARDLLTEALRIVDRTQERWFEAELHRLRAEIGRASCRERV